MNKMNPARYSSRILRICRTGRGKWRICPDVATREIVAYEVMTTLTMEIVYRTLKKLKEALDGNVHPEAMIHSNQGFHYTHPEYQQRVKELKLAQSMSRRGNCLNNAR